MKSVTYILHNSKVKAFFTKLLFLFFGIFGWVTTVTDPSYSAPLAIFYFTLVVNTFFSIILFARITPPSDVVQHLIDILLVCLYAILAFLFNSVTFFALASVFLFITASAKYAFLLNKIGHPKLFKRKILIDILGTFTCTVILTTSLLGHETIASWALAIGFLIANFLVFFVWPLYRADTE